MEQKLNKIGNRVGMHRAENPMPAKRSHPWFKAKHGSAQFKDPEGYTRNKFEDPHDDLRNDHIGPLL